METSTASTATAVRPVHRIAGAADPLFRLGRGIALLGIILPLLLIGGLKFTQVEIDALKPIIAGTPWLAWMYPVLGEAGASYFLGIVELSTAALLMASPWSARAAVVAGALASLTFLTTCSIMLALPIWEPTLGFPAIGPIGQFLVKDVTMLGVAIVVLAEGLTRMRAPAEKAEGAPLNGQDDPLAGIERKLWSNDPEFYRATYLPDAILVFDQIGRISRDEAVQAIYEENASGRHWAEVKFDDLSLSRPVGGVALLSYKATARWNHEQVPSSAFCSTLYVRKEGGWRIALHQQTPA